MPVHEVADVLAATDPDARATLIAGYLERLEDQLDHTRAAVSSLRRLLQPDPAPFDVELRRIQATIVAAVGGTVDRGEVLDWYGQAMDELDHALDRLGLTPSGPPGGLYDNELFTEERGGVVVYVPVPDPLAGGRVRPFVVPARELAVTVHHGPHDDIDVSYVALGTYITEHALAIAGPVHENYPVSLRDTDDSSAWLTEIGWPVFRTTSN